MEDYILGEIKRGRELGTTSLKTAFMWVECPVCKKRRWTVTIGKKLNKKPRYTYCVHCRFSSDIGKKELINMSKRMSGKFLGVKSPMWEGGRFKNKDGYVTVSIYPGDPYFPMSLKCYGSPRYRIPEHRLVMAKHLGRLLLPTEMVHHKNGIRDDNRIENLELTDKVNHLVNHHKGYQDGFRKGYEDGLKMAMKSCQ